MQIAVLHTCKRCGPMPENVTASAYVHYEQPAVLLHNLWQFMGNTGKKADTAKEKYYWITRMLASTPAIVNPNRTG